MCDDCFKIEIIKFNDGKHWASFDLELSRKLGQGKLIQVDAIGIGKEEDDVFHYIYKCLTCNQTWKLCEPNYEHGGGSFTTLPNLKLTDKRK